VTDAAVPRDSRGGSSATDALPIPGTLVIQEISLPLFAQIADIIDAAV
jgi:hypothetical protein